MAPRASKLEAMSEASTQDVETKKQTKKPRKPSQKKTKPQLAPPDESANLFAQDDVLIRTQAAGIAAPLPTDTPTQVAPVHVAQENNHDAMLETSATLHDLAQAVASEVDYLNQTQQSQLPQQPKKARGRPKKKLAKDNDASMQGSPELLQGINDAAAPAALDIPTGTDLPLLGSKRKRHLNVDANDASVKKQKTNPNAIIEIPANLNMADLPVAGPFDDIEKNLVTKFTNDFKSEHRMDEVAFNEMVQEQTRKLDELSKEFWSRVYGDKDTPIEQQLLPNRDKQSKRRYLRRKFHNYQKRGIWEPEDDELLKRAHEAAGSKPEWVKIGRQIGRMPEDCRDRWRNYHEGAGNRRFDTWTEKEELALKTAVEALIAVEEEKLRKSAAEEGHAYRGKEDWSSTINWAQVSAKLEGTRSRLQCYQHWKRMLKRNESHDDPDNVKAALTGEDDEDETGGKKRRWRRELADKNFRKMLAGDQITILRQIADSETLSEDRIPWKKISVENPDSKWSTHDRKHAFHELKKIVNPEGGLELSELVKAIIQHIEREHPDQLDQFYKGTIGRPVKTTKPGKKPKKESLELDETAPLDLGFGVDDFPMAPQANMIPSSSQAARKAYKSAETIDSDHDERTLHDQNLDVSRIDPALNEASLQIQNAPPEADALLALRNFNPTHQVMQHHDHNDIAQPPSNRALSRKLPAAFRSAEDMDQSE